MNVSKKAQEYAAVCVDGDIVSEFHVFSLAILRPADTTSVTFFHRKCRTVFVLSAQKSSSK